MRRRSRLTARLNLVFGIIVALVAINAAVALRAAHERNDARDASTALREVSAASTTLAQTSIDQETDQRGFLITGDLLYLDQYQRAGARFDDALARLQDITRSDETLQAAVARTGDAMAAWRKRAEGVEIQARQDRGAAAAAKDVSTGEGKALFDNVRAQTASLQAQVDEQLQRARDRSTAAYDVFVEIVFVSLGAVAAITITLAILLSRWVTRPVARLAGSVEAVRSGNLDQHVDISGPSEMVQIGTSVESMRRRLVDEIARTSAASAELATANAELQTFSYSVSHDLRAPLRAIDGFSQAIVEDAGDRFDEVTLEHFARIRAATQRMAELIDDLLKLSRVSRVTPVLADVDVSALAARVIDGLKDAETGPPRQVEVTIQPGLHAEADASLVQVVLENLLGNAWKFTSHRDAAHISVTGTGDAPHTVFSVADDGAGFDQTYADKLFVPFQRLHSDREFAGTGIGLATVSRIVKRHGGQVEAHGTIDEGAVITFTLARDQATEPTDGER